MNDTINRQAAIAAADRADYTGLDVEDVKKVTDEVIKEIKKLPTAGRIGKWIKVSGYCTPGGDPVWACSECGKGIHVYGIEYNTYGLDISDGQWVACPNCGSNMVEGEE